MERRAAISLQDFVKAKQHDASYARKLQKDKARRAAKIQREYRRALKKEGYNPDEGEKQDSKKEDDKTSSFTNSANGKKRPRGASTGADESATGKPPKAKKLSETGKHDRFSAARKEAEDREAERIRKQKEREDRAKDAERKRKERKQLKRKLSRKTRKGQPILRHKMDHLLSKLEKEHAESASR
ncbi:Hypothetical Protein FCC1311_075272 [Hondaea fermentalgiana]|uniref:rRNA-processing protein FYV7 n=1 Tax=Hondaea fermentalgiana TaxID=2315210 RepID=A0A2R5GTT6_9STRA|nr:Hypothetical Protein FCC1311_075272 [Hondaea fermentalgiana]|eukprot:GBG31304.1 Hypothetical Protein FCC1311_075272 [Hondaea fermentalgiana]